MSFPDVAVFFPRKKCPVHGLEPLIKLVSREEWGAAPPVSTKPMQTPSPYVRYTFTATPESTDHAENVKTLQRLQKTHMEEENLPDIQYNFMIGGDGTVYEGRGWTTDSWKPPHHRKHLQGRCVDVAYMGDYTKHGSEPNLEMLKAGHNFLCHGVEEKFLDRPFKVYTIRE